MLQSHGGPDLVLRRGGAVPLAPNKKHSFVSQQGGGMTPPACDTKPWICTYKICIMRTSGFVSQARGGCPPRPVTQNRGFVSQTRLWTLS